MKWAIIISWILNVFLAWGISKNYQFSELTLSLNSFLIISAFLSIIIWPVYWVFSISEQLENSEETPELLQIPAEIFIDNIMEQQNFENTSPLIIQKSEIETETLFLKIVKFSSGTTNQAEVKNIKKQTQIKILSLLNDQLFALEKLQEEMLMIVEISQHLNDAEKMILCHNIKQYIAEKKDNLMP